MASKKRQDAPEEGRTARGSGEQRGTAHTTPRARMQPPNKGSSTPREHGQEAPAAPSGAQEPPPPGLDAARHAAGQRTSHQAEVIRKGVFPSLMATALGFDNLFDSPAYKLVLEQVLQEAGTPDDP